MYPWRRTGLPGVAGSWKERLAKRPVVFIVDDDADVRDSLRELLASVGLRVVTFASIMEFRRYELPDSPCCLTLDVRFPGKSGLDFQSELKKRQIDIPIIFITGHGDIPMAVRAMKEGAVEFITKPIREQDLLDAVRVAIERDRVRREDRWRLHDLRARYETLSPREKDTMSLVTSGLMNKQAAGAMGISEITVKVHRHNVMRKLGVRSLPELVRVAEALKTLH